MATSVCYRPVWRQWPVELQCPECGETWQAYHEEDSACGVSEYVTRDGDPAGKCPVCGDPWPDEVSK